MHQVNMDHRKHGPKKTCKVKHGPTKHGTSKTRIKEDMDHRKYGKWVNIDHRRQGATKTWT